MRQGVRNIVAVLCMAAVGPAHALELLPWRLADYPTGGRTLASMVSGTLARQGELTVPTCIALSAGNVQQIASGVTGIAESIPLSESDNAALIIDNLPACCQTFSSLDVDTRITLGAAIALETRILGEADLRSAREVELVIGICEDEILQRSYEIARGQDNLGQLIAQEETGTSTDPDPIPDTTTGGGGVPSPN